MRMISVHFRIMRGRPKVTQMINKYEVLKACSPTRSYRKEAKELKKQRFKISYVSIHRIVNQNKVLTG